MSEQLIETILHLSSAILNKMETLEKQMADLVQKVDQRTAGNHALEEGGIENDLFRDNLSPLG